MKKTKSKATKKTYSLGELIAAVSAASSNELETVIAVKDMFANGIVRLEKPVPARVKH